jgi:DNA invertase Pin-like site-specific DNA recombinase
MAEFERELIRERVKAGMRNARAKGTRIGKPRANVDTAQITRLRAQGLVGRKLQSKWGLESELSTASPPATKPTC